MKKEDDKMRHLKVYIEIEGKQTHELPWSAESLSPEVTFTFHSSCNKRKNRKVPVAKGITLC